jgi:hypothetical protein
MGITNRRSAKHARVRSSVKRDIACRIALVSLLTTLAGCDGSLVEPFVGGKAPVGGEPAASPPSPSPTPTPPPITPSGIPIYVRVSPSFIPGTQRYVFYDDGTFGLQYVRPDVGFFEYGGGYSRPDSVISFLFDANGGDWTATGTVRGDSLFVKHNLDMLMSDFEDGVYVLSSTESP